ncbi:MAG: hypothetical protein IKX43_05650 [Paludibacteraceae bacterium]|nr:hypothetical protein [Paludibacteraceae bacterium]
MKINDDQMNFVIDYLTKLRPDGFCCPICGGKEWNVGRVLVETREFSGGYSGETIAPYVPLTCTKCFNTMFLNAILLGIVDPNKHNPDPTKNIIQ